ncbi:MAG: DivIVA domain-containing protein [Clostridiales bacterium]|jgi:cell division septum initiation protein DivIVA|nr:DivIVA domain-containing protein [Clostridiales bacterium]
MTVRFNHVKRGGYNPAEVEHYVSELENQLKLYRDKDATINQAIISAQAAAEGIVQNAKNQGRTIRESVARQLEDVSMSVAAQKLMLSNFVNDYNDILSKYLRVIDDEDFKGILEKIDSIEAYLRDFSQEVHEDLQIERRLQQGQRERGATDNV